MTSERITEIYWWTIFSVMAVMQLGVLILPSMGKYWCGISISTLFLVYMVKIGGIIKRVWLFLANPYY